jgi:hypothetical protein
MSDMPWDFAPAAAGPESAAAGTGRGCRYRGPMFSATISRKFIRLAR